jgi:hypothetical protein
MRHTPFGRTRSAVLVHAAVLSISIGGAVACGNNPVAPTPAGQAAPAPQSISITGAVALQRPGDTGRLNAIVSFADGTTRNVSSEASWTEDPWDVVYVLRGLVTVHAYGQCYVKVTYGLLSARVFVRVVPDGMFLVSGHVTEETGMPLLQARVRVTSPSGEATTMTDFSGLYMLPGRGDSVVRVEMDDFEPQLKPLAVVIDEQLDFQMKFKTGGFGGVYRLSFVASGSCKLPADVMRRTYMARLTETAPGALVVLLSGAEFAVWGDAGFIGTRDGSTLRFEIASDYFFDYQFIEAVDGTRELALSGTAAGTVGSTFGATFNGIAVVRKRSGVQIARCDAPDHRLEFER